MYYYLKSDTFFVRIENGGIFFRNNFGNIKISSPNSYDIFSKLLRYLDGKFDLESELKNFDNKNLKEYISKLLKVLVEKKFMINSHSEILFENYSPVEQMCAYYNIPNIQEEDLFSSIEILITGYDDVVEKIIKKNLSLKKIEFIKTEDSYFTIEILNSINKSKSKYYISLNDNTIFISEQKKFNNYLITQLPFHALEIVTSVFCLELFWDLIGYKEMKFKLNDYVFDLSRFEGDFQKIKEGE